MLLLGGLGELKAMFASVETKFLFHINILTMEINMDLDFSN